MTIKISEEFYDPHARRKKLSVTIFVLFLVGLVFVVFSVFGKLLIDYLDFEATRVEASKKLEDMQSRFNEQEEQLSLRKKDYESQIIEKKDRLQQLNDDIAKRESKIATQQKLITEYDTLAEVVSALQKNYLLLFKEWDALKQNNASQEGIAAAIKIELNSLSSQKDDLQNYIQDLTKTKKESMESSDILMNSIKTLEQTKSKVQSDILEIKQSLDENSNSLADINLKNYNARILLSQLDSDIAKGSAAYELVKSRISFANETINAKTAENNELEDRILVLKNTASQLTAEISTLEDQKRQAESDYQNIKNEILKGEARLRTTNQKMETSTSPLLKMEGDSPRDDKPNSLEIQENNPSE
jgi:chromosome segregation ATPase